MSNSEEARESTRCSPAGEFHFHSENQLCFKKFVDAAVNETIVGLLGRDASQSFFAHLRDERGIPRDMVGQRLDALFVTMDRIFGLASRTVGMVIIRNLYRTLSLKFVENPHFNLSDYVQEALFDHFTEITNLSDPKTVHKGTGTSR